MTARLSLQTYTREHAVHAHGWFQLVLPLAGALDIDVGGHGARLARGRIAWIASGCRHGFRADGGNRFVVADVPCALAESLGLDAMPAFLPQSPASARLALALARRGDPAALAQLLAATLQPADARAGECLQRLAAAIARIRLQPAAAHPVADLAAMVGLRPARFRALFAAATGLSPRAFVVDCRLDLAERLLRTTRHPLADVALACGFSEQSALTRALQRERGLSPGSLRRA